MAQIENTLHRNTKSSTSRVRIQMNLTPMVDLGFLLITFFILSATLSKSSSTDLLMPKDSEIKTILNESTVLTLMPIRNNEIDYFEGRNNVGSKIKHCSYAKLRYVIQQKQNEVAHKLGDKDKTVIIIDPGPQSSYKNFMDILDEIQINDIRHYFVVNHNS